jgi:hypothetical protein
MSLLFIVEKLAKLLVFNTFCAPIFCAFQKSDVVVFLGFNKHDNFLTMFMVIVDNFERNRLFC